MEKIANQPSAAGEEKLDFGFDQQFEERKLDDFFDFDDGYGNVTVYEIYNFGNTQPEEAADTSGEIEAVDAMDPVEEAQKRRRGLPFLIRRNTVLRSATLYLAEEGAAPPASVSRAAALQSVLDGLADTSLSVYNLVADFGGAVYSAGKQAFLTLVFYLQRPARSLVHVLQTLWSLADSLLLESWHVFAEDLKQLRRQNRRLRQLMRKAGRNPFKRLAVLWQFEKKTVRSHKRLLQSVVNVLLPAAATLGFFLTILYWNNMTFALQVNYNDRNIGYISDESIYVQAQELARDRIDVAAHNDETAEEVIAKPQYELKQVSLNQLNDANTLCDKLIENSSKNLTNAVGIFVDNQFLCAIKNRADAENVFNNLLEPYQTGDEDSFVDFVENVEYRQGLYEDDAVSMWDASRLTETLDGVKEQEKSYTVQRGDTISDIATAHGLTEDQLQGLNPRMNRFLREGETLVVSGEVSFMQVKTVRTESRVVEIEYQVQKVDNASMFRGDLRPIRNGVLGQERVTELVTYIDGERVSAAEVDRELIREPVNAKVEVGTKSTRVSTPTGEYQYSAKGFLWPAPACPYVSSPYGYRRSGFHKGVDLTRNGGGSAGLPVVASRDGVVELVQRSNSGFGNQVVINHEDGYKTRYAHLQNNSIIVKTGQRVSAGQAVGRVGDTGNSTGPHLHFEVLYRGDVQNPLNYIKYS